MTDLPLATEVGDAFGDDAQAQATSPEARTANVDPVTGKHLPTFRVLAPCVLQGTCVTTNGLFKLDPDGKFNPEGEARAVCAVQPRSAEELETFRQHAKDCPVTAIIEVPPAE
jgi:ferredoxin